jgi:hypothetical protein
VEVDDGDSSEGWLGPFWTDADHLAIDGEKLAGSAEMEEQVVVRRGREMAVIGEGKEEGGRKMRCGESRRVKDWDGQSQGGLHWDRGFDGCELRGEGNPIVKHAKTRRNKERRPFSIELWTKQSSVPKKDGTYAAFVPTKSFSSSTMFLNSVTRGLTLDISKLADALAGTDESPSAVPVGVRVDVPVRPLQAWVVDVNSQLGG